MRNLNILFALIIISGIILVIFMLRRLKFTQIFLCLCSGMAALFCSDFIMSMTGILYMPINIYTMAISAIGGIPGVILLVLLDILR